MAKCSECNSERVIGWGVKVLRDPSGKGMIKVRRYQCQACGHVGYTNKSDSTPVQPKAKVHRKSGKKGNTSAGSVRK